MVRSLLPASLAVVAWLCPEIAVADCYTKNGTNVIDILDAVPNAAEFLPCGNRSPTMPNTCCVLNPTDGGIRENSPDLCLANGLCQYDNPVSGGVDYYRNFCSDKDGEGCLDIDCPSSDGFSFQLFPCGSQANSTSRWCCGNDDSCCSGGENDPNLRILDPIIPQSTTVSTSTGVSSDETTTATSSPSTPSTPQTNTEGSSSQSGLSTGAIVGIVIGAVAGLLLLLALGYLIAKRRKSRSVDTAYGAAGAKDTSNMPYTYYARRAVEPEPEPVYEVPGHTAIHELDTSKPQATRSVAYA